MKVFVLRKLDLKECHADICGVYSEEGKKKALDSFVDKQKELNKKQIHDIELNIASQKKERAHDTLVSSQNLGNYDEVETTGRIMYQPFGLNRKPYLVCDRHGEFDVIEDYYNKKQEKVQSVRYQHRSIVAPQRVARPVMKKTTY